MKKSKLILPFGAMLLAFTILMPSKLPYLCRVCLGQLLMIIQNS